MIAVIVILLSVYVGLTVSRSHDWVEGAAATVASLCVFGIGGIVLALMLALFGVGSHSESFAVTVAAQDADEIIFNVDGDLEITRLSEVELRSGCEGYLREDRIMSPWMIGIENVFTHQYYQCVEAVD